MIQKKSEDAVSPVIGVMLLLVVTIVIAAVVAVFASGVGADAEPAPVTVVTVTDVSSGEMREGEMLYEIRLEYQETVIPEVDDNYEPTGFLINLETGIRFGHIDFDTGKITPLEGQEALFGTYMVGTPSGSPTFEYSPKVTLSSLHGDALDLSKISVTVHYNRNNVGEGDIEGPKTPLSGTLMPGDSVEIPLSNEYINGNQPIVAGDEIEVIVYYGSHVLKKAEEITVSGTGA